MSHRADEPCPVVDLLVNRFGEDFGGYLLWNHTCFPFDDAIALRQAKILVEAADAGILDQILAEQEPHG